MRLRGELKGLLLRAVVRAEPARLAVFAFLFAESATMGALGEQKGRKLGVERPSFEVSEDESAFSEEISLEELSGDVLFYNIGAPGGDDVAMWPRTTSAVPCGKGSRRYKTERLAGWTRTTG